MSNYVEGRTKMLLMLIHPGNYESRMLFLCSISETHSRLWVCCVGLQVSVGANKDPNI